MANKSDVQYVRYYSAGSAARKIAPLVIEQPKVAPKHKKAKKVLIFIDPVAIFGMMTAAVLLGSMLFGMAQLNEARDEYSIVQQQVQRLVEENKELEYQYAHSYDLEQIEQTALALGMVPVEQVQHIPLQD